MDKAKRCTCTPQKIKSYWERLSGPILDRIDMYIEVPRLKKEELLSKPAGERSKDIQDRIQKCRELQGSRFLNSGTITNASMVPRELQQFCQLDAPAQDLLRSGIEQLQLTGRSYDRVLRISRTIADLAGAEQIASAHIAEALQYRNLLYKN